MTTPTASAVAHCEDCSRAFRIPNPEKTYTCKVCGGRVLADESPHDPEPSIIESMVTCYDCQALSPRGTNYCVICGATLEHTDPLPGSEAATRLRHEAADELKDAYQMINRVTNIYRFGAVAYAIATLFAVLALTNAEVPENPGILVVALTTAMCVMLLMGALHILFKPFLWTVGIASVATVITAVHVIGPNPFGVAFLGSALWAALAWCVLLPTYRFQQQIASHRDQYILHHASRQTRRSLQGRSAEERHNRLLRAMRRAARRTWRVSTMVAGGFVLVSILGTSFVISNLRAQDFYPLVDRFEAAWQASDLESINELIDPQIRRVESARVAGLIKGHGWGTTFPSLGERKPRLVDEDDVAMDYAINGEKVSTLWVQTGNNWSLVKVDLPLPPFDSTAEQFREAWNGSDPKAIAAFFSPDAEERMRARIQKSVTDRGWTSFPKIVSTDFRLNDEDKTLANFVLSESQVETEWFFRTEGEWCMHVLRFPER